jgi:urea transport system substrate-binding protein
MVASHSRPGPHVLIGVAVATSLALSACSGAAVSDKPKGRDSARAAIRIGLVVPLTGPVSSTGKALEQGFRLGVKKVNAAGGVNGKPVTYVVEDDGGNPATSTQLARKLVQQDKVSLLFGTITGDTAEAVAAVADASNVPFGTAILGDTNLCHPYVWGFGESTRQFLGPDVPQLIRKFGTRVAIVGSDYNYPHYYAGLAKQYVKDAGGSVVDEEYSPLGQTDWQPVIKRLQAAKHDVLLSMVVGADAVAFSQQAKQFGLITPELGYEGAPLESDYYPALAALVTGRTHVVRWTDQLADPESQQFVAQYRSQYHWKLPMPEVAGNAYFGIQFMLKAAGKGASADPATINEAISTFTLDSPLGNGTHFAPNHVLQANMLEVTIRPGGYQVTKNLGPVPDTSAKHGCS